MKNVIGLFEKEQLELKSGNVISKCWIKILYDEKKNGYYALSAIYLSEPHKDKGEIVLENDNVFAAKRFLKEKMGIETKIWIF